MADITITAQLRPLTGSRPTGRLRSTGKLPGVIYGKGDPVSIVLDHREVRNTFNDVSKRGLEFTLVLDGVSQRVKIQEIQRHPVRHTATHLDLVRV